MSSLDGSDLCLATVMDQVSNKLHDVKFNGIYALLSLKLRHNLISLTGTLGKNSEFTGHWGDPNEAMDRAWNKWGFGAFGTRSRAESALFFLLPSSV